MLINDSISLTLNFWIALAVAPVIVAIVGAAIERYGLRHIHRYGHAAELLFTFGLSYIVVELVQVTWGRAAVRYSIPAELDGPLFTLYGTSFPIYRGFMMLVALLMMLSIYLALTRTRVGLVVQAALTHPGMVEALGHNIPRVFTLVFAGGCGLAALAGVIGGNAFVTEPGMAATVGSIIFVVVVVGGLGSLVGALSASLLIGMVQTFAVSLDYSVVTLLAALSIDGTALRSSVLRITIAQMAPMLPYMLLVLVLIFRPKGLMGTREG